METKAVKMTAKVTPENWARLKACAALRKLTMGKALDLVLSRLDLSQSGKRK
jgi:hypothetical protein